MHELLLRIGMVILCRIDERVRPSPRSDEHLQHILIICQTMPLSGLRVRHAEREIGIRRAKDRIVEGERLDFRILRLQIGRLRLTFLLVTEILLSRLPHAITSRLLIQIPRLMAHQKRPALIGQTLVFR